MNMHELKKYLESVSASIDIYGELPYIQRLSIYNELKKLSIAYDFDNMIWKNLEVVCTRKVLPIWFECFPNENTPVLLLDKAVKQLHEGEYVEGQTELMGNVKTYLDNKFDLGEDVYKAIYVGFACWASAGNVFYGFEPPSEAKSELELEPEEWSAAFYSSLAFSGGAVWEEGVGDSGKRREFWLWYLKEAIPDTVARL